MIDDCYDFQQDFPLIRKIFLAATAAAIPIRTDGFGGVP
jgi:hypothetical protein